MAPPRLGPDTMASGSSGSGRTRSIATAHTSSPTLIASTHGKRTKLDRPGRRPGVRSQLREPVTSANSRRRPSARPGTSILGRLSAVGFCSSATGPAPAAPRSGVDVQANHATTAPASAPRRGRAPPRSAAATDRRSDAFARSGEPANSNVSSYKRRGRGSRTEVPLARPRATTSRRTAPAPPTTAPLRTLVSPAMNVHVRPNRSPIVPPSTHAADSSAYAVTPTDDCRSTAQIALSRGQDAISRSWRSNPTSAARRSAAPVQPTVLSARPTSAPADERHSLRPSGGPAVQSVGTARPRLPPMINPLSDRRNRGGDCRLVRWHFREVRGRM